MALQPIESLAPQRRKTLELMAQGMGNVQLAQRYRVALGDVTGMLDEIYTALGIEPTLPKQEKRTQAIDHYKKSTGALAIFESQTPVALLEGLKPWQRQALALSAQDKSREEISAAIGLKPDAVDEAFARFMMAAKVSTHQEGTRILKEVMAASNQSVEPERGYTNGHDRTANALPARTTSDTASPLATEGSSKPTELTLEPNLASATSASEDSTAPAAWPLQVETGKETSQPKELTEIPVTKTPAGIDPDLLDRARKLVVKHQTPTTKFLNEKLSCAYVAARSILEALEKEGLVGSTGTGVGLRRHMLVGPDGTKLAKPLSESSSPPPPSTKAPAPQPNTARGKFSDKEKAKKLNQLIAVVGEESELGRMLAEVIDDLQSMDKVRKALKVLNE